jgi:PadR family transcriptional regulator PadR
MNIENIKAQMRKGVLEFCLLSVLRNGEHYPTEILDELKKADLIVVEGTLYPILTRLKNEGMLQYRWVESNAGPPRKYFQITEKGESFWHDLHSSWTLLNTQVQNIIQKLPVQHTDNASKNKNHE